MNPWHVLSTKDREHDFQDGLLMDHSMSYRCIFIFAFVPSTRWLDKSGTYCETICYEEQ